MVCPLCPTAGFFGGVLGAFIGIRPPIALKGRCFSILATGGLVALTVLCSKVFFNYSLCQGADFTLKVICQILAKTLILGVIYSIGVNYLISRYAASQPTIEQCPCCQEG
ncbi:MAG: hypothetical protein LW832_05260 [Parachlamydia sp.]|jgi:hypothetical protein|nr:hypothetical protein [Parachlamydia sp.]